MRQYNQLNLPSRRATFSQEVVGKLAHWRHVFLGQENSSATETFSLEPCVEETTERISLGQGQTWSRRLPADSLVQSLFGTLWVTRDDEQMDEILQPGEQIMLPRDSYIVVSTLGQETLHDRAMMLLVTCNSGAVVESSPSRFLRWLRL